MKAPRRIRKILWAVDAFQPKPENLRPVGRQVSAFAKLSRAEVEVAYVYKVPQMLMSPESFKAFQEPYLAQARKNLSRIAGYLDAPPDKITIVTNDAKTKDRDEIGMLLGYAGKTKADVIAVASHGRGALLKFFIGSFADSLLKNTDRPLLVVGPHQKKRLQPPRHRALFPVDLGRKTKAFFETFLALAQTLKLDLHLVHGVLNQFVPPVLSDAHLMGGFYPAGDSFLQESLEKQKAQVKDWLALCKKRGLKATADVYTSGGLVSDVICQAALQSESDFIVMTPSASGPSPGSVTRKVIRSATVPVLVFKRR